MAGKRDYYEVLGVSKDADDETRGRVLAAIEDALRARVQNGAVHATRGVHLVVARA